MRCMNMRTTRDRACARAAAGMRWRRSRRWASTRPACSRRSSWRSTGGSRWRSSRPIPRWISRPSLMRWAAAARRRAGRRGGEGDGLRARRDLAPRDAAAAAGGRGLVGGSFPTIHVSAGRRGLEIELAAGRPRAADRRAGWRRSPGADRLTRGRNPGGRATVYRPCPSASRSCRRRARRRVCLARAHRTGDDPGAPAGDGLRCRGPLHPHARLPRDTWAAGEADRGPRDPRLGARPGHGRLSGSGVCRRLLFAEVDGSRRDRPRVHGATAPGTRLAAASPITSPLSRSPARLTSRTTSAEWRLLPRVLTGARDPSARRRLGYLRRPAFYQGRTAPGPPHDLDPTVRIHVTDGPAHEPLAGDLRPLGPDRRHREGRDQPRGHHPDRGGRVQLLDEAGLAAPATARRRSPSDPEMNALDAANGNHLIRPDAKIEAIPSAKYSADRRRRCRRAGCGRSSRSRTRAPRSWPWRGRPARAARAARAARPGRPSRRGRCR